MMSRARSLIGGRIVDCIFAPGHGHRPFRRALALVRLAVGGRGDAAADDAGQDDDRHDVGQRGEELLGDGRQDPAQLARRRRCPDGDPERAGCGEQERRPERPERVASGRRSGPPGR